MSFLRKGSQYLQVQVRLPGIGRTPQLTTRTPVKRDADAMERALIKGGRQALTDPIYMQVVRKVFSREIDLPTFYVHHNFGSLAELVEDRLLLIDAIREYRKSVTDRHVLIGLDALERHAPDGIGADWLLNSLNITRFLEQCQAEGNKRNSVRRRPMRATSKLLARHFGRAERNRIFADVDFRSEDDSREVFVSPVEITRLLDSCDGEFRVWVRAAIVTSADRGVLCKLLKRHITIYVEDGAYSGSVFLEDRKNDKRSRTVAIAHDMCTELLPLLTGKEPADHVFSVTYSQVDYLWQRAREKAGFSDLRVKDLRHCFGVLATHAGIDLNTTSKGMGHSNVAMTTRYIAHQTTFDAGHAALLEQQMKRTGMG
ncbi:tyrosine-type recombinase/integrase [Bacteroidota bacterium]